MQQNLEPKRVNIGCKRSWSLKKQQLELNMKALNWFPSTEGCANKIFWKENTQSAGLSAFLSQLAFHHLAVSTTMTSPLGSAGTALYASPEAARHAQGLSLRNFLASLVTSAVIFATEVCLFLLLKDRLKQI